MRNGEQTIRDALKKAQAVLCQYLEPDGPNENQTVKQLFGILNDREVIRALARGLNDPAGVASPGAGGQPAAPEPAHMIVHCASEVISASYLESEVE